MELGAKWAELVQKFVPRSRVEIFQKNAPNPPHWILNRRFGAFRSIWVYSEPFGSLTKLGATRAEVVQKFVPRSRVRIFCNERTRSTPLDPKLIFLFVLYYLGAFGTGWLPYEIRCKTGRSISKVCATKSRRNFYDPRHCTVN